jgi:pimeloyl-ACP methyl ester carboxylesterase
MPPPPRPSARQEKLAARLFQGLAPRLPRVVQPDPPEELRPWEGLEVRRPDGRGVLGATWYPAPGRARGAVLLLPPWLEWGRAYFHRRGRIETLRASGYHALALDLPRNGNAFFDRDLEEGLAELHRRAPGLPLHVWGVSSGGYWMHPVLARTGQVTGAFFEDVSPHLIEWSCHMAPWGLPAYRFFQHALRSSYRFLDMRRHAAALRTRAVAYVGGGRDRGVRPADTRTLAERAGARCHIVEKAGHLGAIKLANREVLDLALETFRKAEG